MKTVIRFDQGSLRKPEMLPNGFMKVDGLVARVGVLEYRNDDGSIRRELRLREDVADPKSLSSYEGASLTDGHPTVLVDSENVRTLEEGSAANARMDGDWVAVPMVLKSKKLIGKVRAGKTGLSAGYTIKLDETPGEHPVYGRYDAIQREIRVNHIAVAVAVPRAGDVARIRMDGADVRVAREDGWGSGKLTSAVDGHQHLLSFVDWNGQQCLSGETSYAMSDGANTSHSHPWVKNDDGTVTIGESEGHSHALLDENRYSATREDSQIDRSGTSRETGLNREGTVMDPKEQIKLLQTQLAEATARASTAEADLKTRTDERDDFKAKLETSEGVAKEKQARLDAGSAAAEGEAVKEKQARIDELEAELAGLRKDWPVKVRERATRVMRAQAVLGDNVRADAMDDRTLLEEGIRRFEPTVKIDKSTSDAYLQARFDSLYESRAASAASLKRAGSDMAIVRTDAARQSEPDPFDPLNNGVGQWASPHATAKKGA